MSEGEEEVGGGGERDGNKAPYIEYTQQQQHSNKTTHVPCIHRVLALA